MATFQIPENPPTVNKTIGFPGDVVAQADVENKDWIINFAGGMCNER